MTKSFDRSDSLGLCYERLILSVRKRTDLLGATVDDFSASANRRSHLLNGDSILRLDTEPIGSDPLGELTDGVHESASRQDDRI